MKNEDIINAFRIEIIDQKKYENLKSEIKKRSKGVHSLEKQNGLEHLSYSYRHGKLYSKISNKYRNKINTYMYDYEKGENGKTYQRINRPWGKYINIIKDKKGNKLFNLCSYVNIVFGNFAKKLDEFEYSFKELEQLIKDIKGLNIEGNNIEVYFIHKLSCLYNILIANILSLYEYIDLFIVIEYIFFEKSIYGKALKDNKIQLKCSRKQRIEPYMKVNNLEYIGFL